MTHRMDRLELGGFGFPVVLLNAPMQRVGGDAYVDLSDTLLSAAVLRALLLSPCRWTGDQVRYVRTALRRTQLELAAALHITGETTVSKWERRRAQCASLDSCVEFSLRVLVLEALAEAPAYALLKDVSSAAVREAMGNAARSTTNVAIEIDACALAESCAFTDRRAPADGPGNPIGHDEVREH